MMDIRYVNNALTGELFAHFRSQIGWGITTPQQAQKAVSNTYFSVVAFDGDNAVGIGRLIGDGAVIWYVQDMIVLPQYQGRGIGSTILNKLIDFATVNNIPDSNFRIALMSAKGKEEFYQKFGFHIRPYGDFSGAGMDMYVQKT